VSRRLVTLNLFERSTGLIIVVAVVLSLFFTSSALAGNKDIEINTVSRAGLKVVTENATRASLSFQLPPLTHEEVWNEGERFDQLSFADDPSAGPEGWPELPSMVRFVLIPPESGVELAISNIRSHFLANINPFPRQPLELEGAAQADQLGSIPGKGVPLIRDSRADEVEGFWPPEVASLGRPAVMRGYRIVPIVINPVRFNAKTHELQVIDDFEIELNYATDANRVNVVHNPERYQTSRAIRNLLNQTVVNPLRDEPSRDPGITGGSVVYVIGAAQAWNQVNDAIQPLVEWRRQMGYPTEVLRVQDITRAGAIKQALQEAYDEWEFPPEYIVLVGDGDRQYALGFFDRRGNAGNPYESDHEFSTLDGDDLWPDAAVGRLAFGTIGMLEGIVDKILRYEQDPFIGQGNQIGWQKRAAFTATARASGTSSVDVLRWSKKLVLDHGYTQVGESYWTNQGQDINPTQFFNEQFRSGVSIVGYRGWCNLSGFTNPSVNQLNNGRMLPFVILATCNTNDFSEVVWGDDYNYCDRFIHYTGGGAIGAVGSGGVTHSAYNNVVLSGIMQNLFAYGVHNQGWATMLGKAQLINNYQGRGDINHDRSGDEAWRTSIFIYNLMGDPTTDLFTDIPRALTVTAPETMRRGETHIEATVLHDDDDSPALDANVCLYRRDLFQLSATPDAEGRVSFDLDPDWTQDGSVMLTVTGHNLFPVLDTLDVTVVEQFIGSSGYAFDDDNDGASRGNGDGVADQLETLELAVDISNLSQDCPEGELNLRLTAGSPEITVVQGAARFDSAPEAGQAVTANFVVRIEGGFPSGKDAVLLVNASVGQESWVSSVSIPVVGPDYEFDSMLWEGGPLSRGAEADMFVRIKNVGGADGPPLNATLISRTSSVGAFFPNGSFRELQIGEVGESEGVFGVSSHPFHLGGQPAEMALALESDAGFRDTVNFTITTTPALTVEPFGPDDYGYVCFEDIDTGWYATPVYNWIELDPRVDGAIDGATDLQMTDRNIDDDTAEVVELPFVFQYYGHDFEEITVSTNGWMATGDCRELALCNNHEIPGGMTAPGMIAPFWDELVTVNNTSGIFTWFDEDSGRFYVEWSQMRRLGQGPSPEAWETFQVILHDPVFWPSFTGDGDIIFQYKDVTESRSCQQIYDTPYATVGIASPDITTGLQYSYWHRPTPGADTLADGRVIKFTTLLDFRQGALTGGVFDALTGNPIRGATINTRYGFRALTDDDGMFRIDNMLVDSAYTVTASKRFYNDSTLTDIAIIEGETTDLRFGLLHPEFSPATDSIGLSLLPDTTAARELSLRNTGNGPLTFKSRFVFAGDAAGTPGELGDAESGRDEPDEAFRLLRNWALSDSLGNPQIQSVVFTGDQWIVAAGRTNNNDSLNYFYKLDREGRLVSQMRQPLNSRLGLRDMEWYDGSIWATNLDTCIYQINPETGEILDFWKTPRNLTSSRCITFNPDNGHIFLSSTTTNIFEYEFDGDTLRQISSFPNIDPRDGAGIRKSGFAWFRDDPNGYPLYIIAYNEVPVDVEQADISIFKMNPANGDIRFVTRLLNVFSPAGGGRGGMTITTKWNSQVWVMAAIIEQARSDQLAIFELAPNTSWISYDPKADTLQAGESIPIELTINSTDLDSGATYIATIEFSHNAAPGVFRLPIGLRVGQFNDAIILDDDPNRVNAFDLRQNYPNPFNRQTRIVYSLENPSKVKLTVWDVTGREVAELVNRPMKQGRHVVNWDAAGLPAGIYLTRLEAGGKTAVRKTVLIK